MSLTEALHFYRSSKRPTDQWMKLHFHHFWPTAEDEKLREKLHKDAKRVRKRKILKELFD